MASPASAALPSLAGMTALQQLTTDVPVVNSSAVDQVIQSVLDGNGNSAAVGHVAQEVLSVHSTSAGEDPSIRAVQP